MKKIGKILVCLCLAFSFAFTGCSLVQRNTERYLNRVVATVGEIEITKQDLVSAYNSYGYQYVNYYGYTTEEAVKTTLDKLVERKILVEKAKELITQNETNQMIYDGKVVFNANVWQNAVWQSTFDAINEQIDDIEDDIREERGLEEEKSEEEEDEEKPDYDPYKEYEKQVTYENGKWTRKMPELDPAEEAKTIGGFIQTKTGDEEVSRDAFKRYIKQLTLNYKSKHLTIKDLKTVAEDELDDLYADLELSPAEKIAFLYELERAYKVYDENKYVEEFENLYKQYSIETGDSFNKKIVNYYKQLVEDSYETYMQETLEDSYSKYLSAMQDDPSKVYYHRDYGTNEKGEKKAFVAVSHVLIKLSDDQTKEIEDLKTELSTGVIGQQEYDDRYAQILDKTVVHARDEDGNETELTKTVAEVREEIYADLAQYSNLKQKAEAFNKYIYKYGQDTGMINAEHYYAVNLDTEVTDKMVKEFADMSRALYAENPNGGNLSEPVFVSQSNYSGYHIIFNAGLFDNELSIEQVRNLDQTDADYLYNKRLMLGTEKSYYDFVYDKIADTIFKNDWSNYQNSLINTAKQNMEIVFYVSAYEDLYKN